MCYLYPRQVISLAFLDSSNNIAADRSWEIATGSYKRIASYMLNSKIGWTIRDTIFELLKQTYSMALVHIFT